MLATEALRDAQAKREIASNVLGDAMVTAKHWVTNHPAPSAEIRDQIANAETVNNKVRANAARREAANTLKALLVRANGLTEAIDAIDEAKKHALERAPFPVEGLSLDESGVIFNGLPFDQASSAEQLRISVAIGLALNPSLKVLLIRDGSLLDADNLAMVAEMAATADAQVWIERVSEGAECQVIIEDGMVKD
jgi:hypothetical protein